MEAAKAVAEAENAEELAAADSARKAGMGMARTQAAAAVPKERTVERAVMEEEAAVARTEVRQQPLIRLFSCSSHLVNSANPLLAYSPTSLILLTVPAPHSLLLPA